MKFYLSTIADVSFEESASEPQLVYLNRTLPVALEYGLGLEIAEFCIAENLDVNIDTVEPIVLNKAETVSDTILHAPFNELFPCAIDSQAAKLATARYLQAADVARKIGAKKVVVHAGYVPTVYYREFFVSQSVKFWKKFLSDYSYELEFCLENVMEYEPEMLTEIIEGVQDKRLRLCLDIGHANLTSTPISHWIDAELPYLSHFHIHNNKGIQGRVQGSSGDLHSALGVGIIDYDNIINDISKILPEATLTVESIDILSCSNWLKEHSFI